MLFTIILATAIIGLVSLTSIVLLFRQPLKPSITTSLVSLAAGSLLAVSFLDLMPEAIESGIFEPQVLFGVTLGSILFFFLFERVLHWHHCRCEEEGRETSKRKHLVYFNLIGDGFHNLIDGFLVAGAFLLNFETGVAVTIAVILHEIPQEISDFGILVYGGLKRTQALLFNFITALTAVVGAILFYFFSETFTILTPIAAAFAAGNFIYMATADVIPELDHEKDPKKVIGHSFLLIAGVLVIVAIGLLTPHE